MPPAGIPLRLLLLRSLRSVQRDVHLVLDPIRLALSVPQALWLLARRRPAAVFTTGGYVAIPVLLAARLLRIPALLWEGNVIPGRSVRATARLATALAVSFEATCRALPTGRACFVTGTPIRDVSAHDRAAARARLSVAPDDRLVVIFGGSQAVRRLNDAVAGAMPGLAEKAVVIHVAGADGLDAAEATRRALPEHLRDRYRPAAFLGEELLDALAAADLIVGPRRIVHPRRGDRVRRADGRRALPVRRCPPAGERRGPRRFGRRPAGRRRGLRRGRIAPGR